MYEVRWREFGQNGPWLGKMNLPVTGSINIGRDEVSDLQLNSGSVSRSHAIIICDKENIKIADVGSTNGTYLEEQPLKHGFWRSGEILVIGNFELHLHPVEFHHTEPSDQADEFPPQGFVGAFAQEAPHAAQAPTQHAFFLKEQLLGFYDVLKLTFFSVLFPVRVAKAVRNSEEAEDYNLRLNYLFKVSALQVFVISFIAFLLNVSPFGGGRVDFLYPLFFPLYIIFIYCYLFFVWKYSRLIKVSFSRFLHAVSLMVGVGVFMIPLFHVPAFVAAYSYFPDGTINPNVLDQVQRLKETDKLKNCVPDFNTLECLNLLGATINPLGWPIIIVLITLFVTIAINSTILKHAIDIKYWKQFLGYLLSMVSFFILYFIIYVILFLIYSLVVGTT